MSDPHADSAGIEDLVARARAGDLEAENVLFARLHSRILALSLRRVRQAEAAQEIAQETIQTLLSKYRTAEMPQGFMPWLFTILHHKVTGRSTARQAEQRRRGPSLGEGATEWLVVGLPRQDAAPALDLARALERALGRLSIDCQTIFRLLLEGAAKNAIEAAFQAEPIGTIDSRVSLCRRRLLTLLEGDAGISRRR